jgi:hypothetical protein
LLVREPDGLGAAMFLDYGRSPVGPYRELLYLPAIQRCFMGESVSISHIYVSTRVSAVNGRVHWAIPKRVAEFMVQPGSEGVRISVCGPEGEVLCMLLRSTRWTLPFTTYAMPGCMRTLAQRSGGVLFLTRPHGHGLLQPARVMELRADPRHFPALASADVAAAFRIRRVRLSFPAAAAHPECRSASCGKGPADE